MPLYNDDEEVLTRKSAAKVLNKKLDRFEEIRRRLKGVSDEFKQEVATAAEPVEFVSTGVRAVDRITNGGIPKGRVTEIYGPFSAGKTLLCQSTIVQLQKEDGWPIFVDRERSYNKEFWEATGVDSSRLVLERRKRTVEDIFDYIMESMEQVRKIDKKVTIGVFIDSIAAANTKKELARKKKMQDDDDARAAWDNDMGFRAKMIGEGCRKLSGIMDERMFVVIINQVRSKVGVVFGNPEVTTGGQALPYFASLRLRVQQGVLKKHGHKVPVIEDGMTIGQHVLCSVTKSKVGPPLRRCEIVQSFEFGFLEWPGLFECLLDEGIIGVREKGKEFVYEGKAHKASRFVEWVKENPDVVGAAPSKIDRDPDDVEAGEDESGG